MQLIFPFTVPCGLVQQFSDMLVAVVLFRCLLQTAPLVGTRVANTPSAPSGGNVNASSVFFRLITTCMRWWRSRCLLLWLCSTRTRTGRRLCTSRRTRSCRRTRTSIQHRLGSRTVPGMVLQCAVPVVAKVIDSTVRACTLAGSTHARIQDVFFYFVCEPECRCALAVCRGGGKSRCAFSSYFGCCGCVSRLTCAIVSCAGTA